MRLLSVWSILIFTLFSSTSCEKITEAPLAQDEIDLLKTGIEIADSVRMIYSDSAYVRAIIESPVMHQRTINRSTEQEFPQGIYAEFFDQAQNLQSTLTSGYALRKEREEQIYVKKKVVLTNTQGEKLETPELVWNEKTKKITTEKAYKITRQDGTIITGYGFTANESFTVFKSHSVQTRFKMNQ